MALIIWDQAYSVGIKALDADHIVIASLINHVDDAKQAATDEATVGSILSALIAYAGTHFRREERMMIDAGYADVERHREEHRLLEEQLVELHEAYARTPDPNLSQEIMELLRFWLVEHILKVDRRYVPSLRAAGLR
ncbi:MAG: hemerythrin family protein [Rhodospirillales bacterium]|nr:hemerythrin family protein [Rhodospirillales bacterium]